MDHKLYRSETDKMVAGVCGGIAEYFNIDSTLIRLIVVFLTLWGGGGIIAYVICWIVIPTKSSIQTTSDDIIRENTQEIKETVSKTAKGLRTEVTSDTKKEEDNGK